MKYLYDHVLCKTGIQGLSTYFLSLVLVGIGPSEVFLVISEQFGSTSIKIKSQY